MRRYHLYPIHLFLSVLLLACQMQSETSHIPSRNLKLALFDPHMPSFVCEVEADKVPAIDAQANAWFLEARALEGPETIAADRDYKKIVQLTRQAAERKHWKAMLNLASFYIEGLDPQKGTEDAVKLVEEGMRMGIPAAYDRMGTYYMNGTGVDQNATRAYAFWLKAAQMGSPQAMTFFGDKLNATYDSENGSFWANKRVAGQMLECAFGQGYGPAAYQLGFLIAGNRPPSGSTGRTQETSARAVWVLHQGVKFGCEDCASKLHIEFDHPVNLADMIAPHIDKARGERYWVLRTALDFDPDLRFPNLDQVLPLPPAELPTWNGDEDTLINAAKGVTLKEKPPQTTAASLHSDRRFLPAAFHFRLTSDTSCATHAPSAGYWKITGTAREPGLYQAGEPFEQDVSDVVWERWDTQWHDEDTVRPRAGVGPTREVSNDTRLMSCPSDVPCPASGVWQPWVQHLHPLRTIVNQPWRQAWLSKGQAFPQAAQDWLLALPDSDITWHLIDKNGVDLVNMPGAKSPCG